MEPDVSCPPHLKGEIVSEIDLIRNSLTIVKLYVDEFFGVFLVLTNPPASDPLNPDL